MAFPTAEMEERRVGFLACVVLLGERWEHERVHRPRIDCSCIIWHEKALLLPITEDVMGHWPCCGPLGSQVRVIGVQFGDSCGSQNYKFYNCRANLQQARLKLPWIAEHPTCTLRPRFFFQKKIKSISSEPQKIRLFDDASLVSYNAIFMAAEPNYYRK